MEVRQTAFLALVVMTFVLMSRAQEKLRNPFIMRERKHCERLAVYEMRRVSDPMIRRPIGRRLSEPVIGPVLRPPVFRGHRLNLMRQNRPPNIPSFSRPPIIPSDPRQGRVKRQTKSKSQPSKPAQPTSITLPDQGTGVLPSMINLPKTGFGSRRSMDIPLIPHNQPSSGLLPERSLSTGQNLKTKDKIQTVPNISGTQMGVFRLVNVPANPSSIRVPVLRHPTTAPYKRVSCLTPGHVCGWERDRKCRRPPCETTPACFLPRGPANKPGKCPVFITKYLTDEFSIRYCFDDSNCRGNQICCHGSGLLAGSACVNPVFDLPRNATRRIVS